MSGGPIARSLPARRVLVTGADGFLGRSLVARLSQQQAQGALDAVVAADVREVPADRQCPGVAYAVQDVRDAGIAALMQRHAIDTVVHLASIVTPGKDSHRAFEHSVDVGGTRNVLAACLAQGVRHLVVSSSGAAYGYHADNPDWIDESQPLRGNEAFAYADHKRQVEELLAQARRDHPELAQTVLRIGTILGERVHNQITALFEKSRLIAIRGSASPFVFIWDEDVTGAIAHALAGAPAGCFNLAGDGALGIREIAQRLGKGCVEWPAPVLRTALAAGSALGLSRYGPEQLDFLRYRPVLANRALKEVFGYRPAKTSAQAFEAFVAARAAQGRPVSRRR